MQWLLKTRYITLKKPSRIAADNHPKTQYYYQTKHQIWFTPNHLISPLLLFNLIYKTHLNNLVEPLKIAMN